MSKRSPHIDRRALFSSAAAATLLAATGVSAASVPQRGGRLRMALSGATRQDNWTTGDGLFMQVARQGMVFDTLTEVAADGTLRSELALAWSSSADGRRWSFDLREGVLFHDGTSFDADDVVASLRPLLDAYIFSIMENRVEIMLRYADHALPIRLSEPQYVIRPKHALDGGIGTGLYRVKSFDPGQRLLAERVSTHYKDGNAGWFDEVELAALSWEGVRREAIAGFMVDAVDLSEAGQLAALPDITLIPDARNPVQAVSNDVALPSQISNLRPLDNLRAAERWWFA